MKRYQVMIEQSAQANVRASYDWGCRNWGKAQAQQWARELRTAILKQLRVLSKAFPLAPENDDFSDEIRQIMVGRYRVLFTTKGQTVHVLHIRGAYVGRRQSQNEINRSRLLRNASRRLP
jgi:plasmid stabilization system protein ParE